MISMFKKLLVTVALCAAVCASVVSASTPQPPDMPRDYVVDLAGIMRSDLRIELNTYLQTLEQKTTAQVLVLTVQTLGNQGIEEFALNTKEKWKLGQKGKDNGVLIVVAVNDRKYRIEVGYGLEGVLPDSMVGSIGREYFVPYFRAGDYSTGIYAGTIAVIKTIAAHENVSMADGPDRTQPRGANRRAPLSAFHKIILIAFGVILLVLCVSHPGQCFLLLLLFSRGRGGGGGWSGGDGGFGGGSFGGGGGGSGGGGGASGGW
jgi:uncharacterized protein